MHAAPRAALCAARAALMAMRAHCAQPLVRSTAEISALGDDLHQVFTSLLERERALYAMVRTHMHPPAIARRRSCSRGRAQRPSPVLLWSVGREDSAAAEPPQAQGTLREEHSGAAQRALCEDDAQMARWESGGDVAAQLQSVRPSPLARTGMACSRAAAQALRDRLSQMPIAAAGAPASAIAPAAAALAADAAHLMLHCVRCAPPPSAARLQRGAAVRCDHRCPRAVARRLRGLACALRCGALIGWRAGCACWRTPAPACVRACVRRRTAPPMLTRLHAHMHARAGAACAGRQARAGP